MDAAGAILSSPYSDEVHPLLDLLTRQFLSAAAGGGSALTGLAGDGDSGTASVLAIAPTGRIILGAGGTRRYVVATQRVYVLQDANYNVTGLVGTDGQVKQRFIYDPYGVATMLDGSWASTTDAYDWRYLHQGGRFDATTGLYHFRNREYSPVLGRWMQQNPMGYVDGMSLYRYELDSPVAHLDYIGLKAYTCIPVVGTTVTGQWSDVMQGAGTKVFGSSGEGGLRLEVRNIRVWFLRPFRQLYQCCDATDSMYLKWGDVGWQVGIVDSTGSGIHGDTVIVLASGGGQLKIGGPFGQKLPIPGVKIPTIVWGNTALNWTAWKDAGAPTYFADIAPSEPKKGDSVTSLEILPALQWKCKCVTTKPGTPTPPPF